MVEIAHSFDLGSFRRSSEFLRDVVTTSALAFDHASLAHLHHASKAVPHKAMIVGVGSVERLDLSETSELRCAVAAFVDVAR